MPDPAMPVQVNLDASRSVELVAIASQAQSDKLRAVLERLDVISRLDQEAVGKLTSVLDAAANNGGCGIGCW